jgi:hypothetical protein
MQVAEDAGFRGLEFLRVAQSRDGRLIAGADGTTQAVTVADAATSRVLMTAAGASGPVALDAAGRLVAYADAGPAGQVGVCEVASGRVVATGETGLARVGVERANLIGYAYAYEQATLLHQPPSAINPTLFSQQDAPSGSPDPARNRCGIPRPSACVICLVAQATAPATRQPDSALQGRVAPASTMNRYAGSIAGRSGYGPP